MAEFVTIRHTSQPEEAPGARTTVKAFETYYKAKGWEKVDDAPVTAPEDPSLSVEQQVTLLENDKEKLDEALTPSGTAEDAAAADADAATTADKTATSKRRGSQS